jgi:hypothetical protein
LSALIPLYEASRERAFAEAVTRAKELAELFTAGARHP